MLTAELLPTVERNGAGEKYNCFENLPDIKKNPLICKCKDYYSTTTLIFSLAADSTNSGGSSTGGGGFAETDFSSASCGSSIDAVGASGAANVTTSSSAIVAGVGAEHQLVRVITSLP